MKTARKVKSSIYVAALVGSLLSTQLLAQQVPQFTDDDGDGVISAEEVSRVRDAMRQDRLAQYDTDGNGELSRTEVRAMKDARYAQTLTEFDADGDGELSRAERRASRDARRALIDQQLDVNQDGEVSDAERAGYEQVMDDRQDGRKSGRGKGGDGEGRRGHNRDQQRG